MNSTSIEAPLTWWAIHRALNQEDTQGIYKHIPDTLVANHWAEFMDSCDPEVDCISLAWDCLDDGDDNWRDTMDEAELSQQDLEMDDSISTEPESMGIDGSGETISSASSFSEVTKRGGPVATVWGRRGT